VTVDKGESVHRVRRGTRNGKSAYKEGGGTIRTRSLEIGWGANVSDE